MHRFRDGGGVSHGGLGCQPAVLLEHLVEGQAVDMLHDDAGGHAAIVIGIQDRDVGMVEFGLDTRFVEEALPGRAAGIQVLEHLDDGDAAEAHVFGPVDITHASGPEKGNEAVLTDDLSRPYGHVRFLTFTIPVSGFI
jgi:hypothetical protein